jgi:hypothetical protein
MAPHQDFGQFFIALRDCLQNPDMLSPGDLAPTLHCAVHASAELEAWIELVAQKICQDWISTSLRDLRVKVTIRVILEISLEG